MKIDQGIQILQLKNSQKSLLFYYFLNVLILNCIRGYYGTQHFVFRFSHFNAAILLADNFCNCLNISCASFCEKKN